MSSVIYWIHLPEHTDIFTEGYVGVSKNVKKRFIDHKNRPSNEHLKNAINKHGWDTLIKQIVIIANEAYCLAIEIKLRASKKIGWNIAEGGSKPPITMFNLGKHLSIETKNKISLAKLGHKHTKEVESIIVKHLIKNGEATKFKKGCIPWNKGLKYEKGI